MNEAEKYFGYKNIKLDKLKQDGFKETKSMYVYPYQYWNICNNKYFYDGYLLNLINKTYKKIIINKYVKKTN